MSNNSASQKNAKVTLTSDLRLPLLKGKESFDEKSLPFKIYEWTVERMFESINEDMKNKHNSIEETKTYNFYYYYINTNNFINNSDTNALLEEEHIKDKYFLYKNLINFKRNINTDDHFLSQQVEQKSKKCYCFYTENFYKGARKMANGGSPNNHNIIHECKRMFEIRHLYESFEYNIFKSKEIKSFEFNPYHQEICLKILFKCKELLSVLRIATKSKKNDKSDLNYLFKNSDNKFEIKKSSYPDKEKLKGIILKLVKYCIDLFFTEVIKIDWNIITDVFCKEFIKNFNKEVSKCLEWKKYLNYFIDNKNESYNSFLNNFIN